MKAAYMLNKQIHVGEVPDPKLTRQGQVLVKTHVCACCASDLHVLKNAEALTEWSKKYNGPFNMDLDRPVVLGHEYVGEIVDYAPGSERKLKEGARVVALPVVMRPDGIDIVGLTNDYPGGFGEYMLLDEHFLLEVPNGLDSDSASLVEPLAVGLHHVRLAQVRKDEIPIVVGCGAIGLAVIAGLKLHGIGPIIAADFSAKRREVALAMGADAAIDPREVPAYGPIPALGNKQASYIFECVGIAGVLDEMFQSCQAGARIMSGGWCLKPDTMFTACAHMKRLNVQFAGGEEPEDFVLSLNSIADGKIDVTPWIGAKVGLSGVGDGLEGITNPDNPIRTLVDPRAL